jgi:hypothetical protein
VSPVKYELGFYIPEDDILHSHCRENFKSYIVPSFEFQNSIIMKPVTDRYPVNVTRHASHCISIRQHEEFTSNLSFNK